MSVQHIMSCFRDARNYRKQKLHLIVSVCNKQQTDPKREVLTARAHCLVMLWPVEIHLDSRQYEHAGLSTNTKHFLQNLKHVNYSDTVHTVIYIHISYILYIATC
jgi:hypothetical protein